MEILNFNEEKNNKYFSSDEDGVLFNKDKTKLLQCPIYITGEEYVIPDGVTEIGTRAFWYCEDLESVTIPGSVTTIGVSAFEGCTALNKIVFAGDAPATMSGGMLTNVVADAYYPANNDGMFSCVGCGRCVDKCPSSLNIVKVIKAFNKEGK